MCLLFFTLNNDKPTDVLEKFMSKSNNNDLHYGYGILYTMNQSWKSYKTIEPPYNDDTYTKYSQSPNMIVHLRQIYTDQKMSKKDIQFEHTIENTHPFRYKNMYFMQHGDLLLDINGMTHIFQKYFRLNNFQTKIKYIHDKIGNKLTKHMQGHTDSELWFYLILHYYTTNNSSKSVRDRLIDAFINSLRDINTVGFQYRSNIVFVHENYIMFSNVYKNTASSRVRPVLLYADMKNDLSVCSTKLTSNYKLLPRNKVYIYNILSKKLTSHDISM